MTSEDGEPATTPGCLALDTEELWAVYEVGGSGRRGEGWWRVSLGIC